MKQFRCDYGSYHTQIDQIFGNQTFSPQNQLLATERIRGSLPRAIDIYAAKTDLSLPIKNGINLSTGLKISKVSIDNKADYYLGVRQTDRTPRI